MIYLTLGQAARDTGRQKSTILEAIRSGRLSASRDEKNQWQIDPAELFRVYEAKPLTEHHPTPPNASEQSVDPSAMLVKEQEERARERRQLEHTIEDLRAERDHWRRQATALLSYQPKPEAQSAGEVPQSGARRAASWVWGFLVSVLVVVVVLGLLVLDSFPITSR